MDAAALYAGTPSSNTRPQLPGDSVANTPTTPLGQASTSKRTSRVSSSRGDADQDSTVHMLADDGLDSARKHNMQYLD